MKVNVCSLDNKSLKEINLDKNIFQVEVKNEIIYRMVRYQLAKKQSGNHSTKSISEISGTTKKPFKQKGTGSARQGSRRSPHMRGGSAMFGPRVRSHAHKLPKKIRSLALKMSLSQKCSEGKIKILSDLALSKSKTSLLQDKIKKFDAKSILFIGGKKIEKNFLNASKNIPNIDVLPSQGLNVYNVLRRDYLFISEDALNFINERFKDG
tara:strand:- start:214 stop:840 length:627 start_codon:yes stop_codon:yes gene_type:complete